MITFATASFGTCNVKLFFCTLYFEKANSAISIYGSFTFLEAQTLMPELLLNSAVFTAKMSSLITAT